ncbi:MAG: SH3 domain-containing protein [Patescibacteria group bacterium]
MRKIIALFVTAAPLLSLMPQVAFAGDCFQDPIYDHDWTAMVTTGARVRDVACMEGSTVLTTLGVGTKVALIAETDGWYKVKTNDGKVGWVGQQLVSVAQTSYTAPATPAPTPTPTTPTAMAPAATRLRGYILLRVEKNGEAWYVSPSGIRYYMKDGATAYQMMRSFGLGMTEADYAKLQVGNGPFIDKLKGKIVLRVQAHGEAYYIHPNGTVHYLRDGAAAYAVMRELSLGIKDADLLKITEGIIQVK